MTPQCWHIRDPLCGAGDPHGRKDTANQYLRAVWQAFRVQHLASGTHSLARGGVNLTVIESGSYVGSGEYQTIALAHPNVELTAVIIVASDAVAPVIRCKGMTDSLLLGVGLLPDLIDDLSAPSRFDLGGGASVNTAGVAYYWSAVGDLIPPRW